MGQRSECWLAMSQAALHSELHRQELQHCALGWSPAGVPGWWMRIWEAHLVLQDVD